MATYAFPYTTPISRPAERERGYAWGTGNYLRDDDHVWLVTNEHVARPAPQEKLSHLPKLHDDYVRVESPFRSRRWPDDLAIARLSDAAALATRRSFGFLPRH